MYILRAEVDEDRLYSESVGTACLNGDDLDEYECDDEETCFVECSEKCDSEDDCDAFIIDGDSCMLYEGCDEIIVEDNSTATVHVCLDGCPDDSEDYYTVNSTTTCKKKTRISKAKTECDDDEFDECVEDCADLCDDNPACTHFVIGANKKCFLYDGCKEKSKKEGTTILGTFRYAPTNDPPCQGIHSDACCRV